MKEILGEAKTIRSLLSGSKYSIDYYQREYKWEAKHITELLDDLTERFLLDYDSTHERGKVQDYGHYFLGSIIVSKKGNNNYVIDGQQRLTTLTLLLIYLQRLQSSEEEQVDINPLIFSEKYGRKSFNLDVEERNDCMEALFKGEQFDPNGRAESIQNLVNRYNDIESYFPEDLQEEVLPYFIDWLIDNVYLVEITTFSDEDAYSIFETMNDRGLSLSPTDMLKGYLLANIYEEEKKVSGNKVWKDMVGAVVEIDGDEASDFFKAWLRGKYSRKIRERKKGAKPEDFDRIGTEFHRWVRDNKEHLGLETSTDFIEFIEKHLHFYSRQYRHVRTAALTYNSILPEIYYLAYANFTLQYPVLLSPLNVDDDKDTIDRKLRIVSTYLDILLARRMWNFRSIAHSTMQYAMFITMREIRDKDPGELATILKKRLDNEQETFSSNQRLRLHQQNRRQIHYMLARITDFIETSSGSTAGFVKYINHHPGQTDKYEIEHIWADKPERHTDEFAHPHDFNEYRNRVGGLLLLPKSFNASYGALTYAEKLPHYDSQNLLARTLNSNCYQRNPGFLSFQQNSQLPFKSHSEYKISDLDERQDLYRKIAEEVWSPDRLLKL